MMEAAWERSHPELVAHGDPLEIDRQRVIRSAAFRRLMHKTQVFLQGEDDHFRTRLTHTLEVADVARRIAARLELDADLAEVAALAHDLGHPPFGHAGERALAESLREHGGFEHNEQSLRVVEYLEHPYPQFRGLNLTRAVRDCLAAHCTRYDAPRLRCSDDASRPEAGVVDLADRLAYTLHDLQDALYARLLSVQDLQGCTLWRAAQRGVLAADDWRRWLRPATDALENRVLDELGRRNGVKPPRIALPGELDAGLRELEELLLARVYRSEAVVQQDHEAQRWVRGVFDACVAAPERMPPRFAARVTEQGAHRVAADYVAGMTDRFCRRLAEQWGV